METSPEEALLAKAWVVVAGPVAKAPKLEKPLASSLRAAADVSKRSQQQYELKGQGQLC